MKKNLVIITTVIALLIFPKVNFGQAPVITVEPINQTVCANSSVSFMVTATGTGLSYQWRKGNVNLINGGNILGADSAVLTINPASYPDVSSNYNVIVTGANSLSDTSTNVSLAVNDNPNVSIANGPTAFCSGDSVSFDAGVQSSYNWSNGATTEIINAVTGGQYTVTVSNNLGCTNTAHRQATALVAPAPNIFSSDLSNICNGGYATLYVGAAFSAYSWNTGDSTQFIAINTGGTYTVTVTNSNGCTGTTSQLENIMLSPTITTNAGTIICSGNSVTLDAGSFTSYLWNTSATSEAIIVSTTGTYSVTVTNNYGCTGTTSQVITVNPSPTPFISANGATTFCTGGSVTLDAGAGYTIYSWNNAATTRTINVSSAGSNSVIVTNSNGCSASSAAINIIVNTTPTIVLSGNLNACPGGNSNLIASGASTYSWSPSTGMNTTTGASVSIHLPSSSPITYTVTGSNTNCSTSMNFTATIGSPAFTSTYTNCLCFGDSSATAAISVTGGGSPYTYTLTNTLNNTLINSSNKNINKLVATRYKVQVTDAGGCTSAMSYIITTQPSSLAFSYSTANINCNGNNNGVITLNASSGTQGVSPNPRYSYTTNANVTTPTYTAGTSNSSSYSFTSMPIGTYYIRVKDANGCLSATTNTVIISQPASITFTDVVVSSSCSSNTGKIILYTTGGTGAYNFSKNGGITWQTAYTFSNLAPGTYVMLVKDANGCQSAIQNLTVGCSGNRIAGNVSASGSTYEIYPNPAHDNSIIEFQIAEANTHVLIEFYDLSGSKIAVLFDKDVAQGVMYQVEINTESLPSGIYYYRIFSGDKILNKKLIVLK